jgi:tetratricopeptide (TPR) repeat protein
LLAVLIAIPVNYRDADAARLTLKRVDYYNFGILYQRRGDEGRAAEMYLRALRIDPTFAPARAGLNSLHAERPSPHPAAERGLALYAAGDYRGAIDAFVAVVAAGMAGPELYNNLGLSHYRLAQYGQALQYYQRALAADSDYVRAYFNTGLALVKTGDDLGAAGAFARAIELDPEHAKAHYRRGAALSRLGRLAAAEKHWSHLKRAYPGDERLRAKIDSIIGATGRR